jgi:hypothetical protein
MICRVTQSIGEIKTTLRLHTWILTCNTAMLIAVVVRVIDL